MRQSNFVFELRSALELLHDATKSVQLAVSFVDQLISENEQLRKQVEELSQTIDDLEMRHLDD